MFNKSDIVKYVKSQGWTGTIPMFNEFRHWRNTTLEEGYDNFVAERNQMFNSIKAEYQSSHSAMSKRGSKSYADNWN